MKKDLPGGKLKKTIKTLSTGGVERSPFLEKAAANFKSKRKCAL